MNAPKKSKQELIENIKKNEAIKRRQLKLKQLLIEEIKNTPLLQVVCTKLDVSRSTVYRWIQEDKDFAREFDLAKCMGKDVINDLAESKLIGKIKGDDLKAIIFWLNHMHPNFIDPWRALMEKEAKKGLTKEQERGLAKRLMQWKKDTLG